MCVVCFNSQWRAVVIGTAGGVLSLGLILVSLAYKDETAAHLSRKLREQQCVNEDVEVVFGVSNDTFDSSSDSSSLEVEEVVKIHHSWRDPFSGSGADRECVYLVFDALFPWPLWTVLAGYFLLSANLVVSALYRFLPGVTAYLALDSVFIGLLATSLCLSFFPSGLMRISLITIIFPLFALALVTWMNVFGFYLRLEDRARRKAKRRDAVRALEDERERRRKAEFENMVLGKACANNVVLNRLPVLVENGFVNEAFTPT